MKTLKNKNAGQNQIFKPAKISFLGIARHEITEPMILLLFVVGFFYSLWGKAEDAITIFIVIFLLVFAEVYNEFRAKKAIASLEKIASVKTKIIKEGKITEIDSENVSLGDILVLTPGTKIAADARIKKSIGLEMDESILTGESMPLLKNENDEIYAGTVIVSGEGEAEVFSIGENTKLGKIAATMKTIKPPKTALQLAMKSLAGKLVYLALFFSIAIPVIGVLRGQNLKTMILTGLSLSFATIPEELPIIITMVLGLGAYTLSKNNFLVKKIKSAEVLGGATCIVTDKTGTITEGKMKISEIYPTDRQKEVLETAYGAISDYSLSAIDKEIENKLGEKRADSLFGEIVRQRNFSDKRKTKAIIRKKGNNYVLFMSGAPEEIFAASRKVDGQIKNTLEKEAGQGKRIIAVASKEIKPGEESFDFEEIEKGMNFSGLICFEDPPRDGVKETIETAQKAGVKTIMVTGDYPATASYVAQKIGILNHHKVLTGDDLNKLSDEELKEVVRETSVFARATPEDKFRIVKALQKNGEVVAVTGDGTNDVLALKAADIGIAMGKKGTDVAKEGAEIILADDNYITITQGIFEGRRFFDNLQKGVKYYLSVKAALILIFLLPVLIGVPMPFSPIQIIILELFMDLAASAGFVAEPQEKNIYSRPPRDPKEDIFNNRVVASVLFRGLILFAAVMTVYFWAAYQKLSPAQIQTFAFSAWIFGHIILAFISRSEKEPVFSLGIFTNKIINVWAIGAIGLLGLGIYIPALNQQLNLTRISLSQIFFIFLIAIFIIGILEIRKFFLNRPLAK